MIARKIGVRPVGMLLALFWASGAFAADVTVHDAKGAVKAVKPGKPLVTRGEASRYEIAGMLKAVTVPCAVCGLNESSVVENRNGRTVLGIRHGGIALDVSRLPDESKFQVRSPMAVAAVRGTRFSGLVHHEGQETFAVEQGVVDVTVKDRTYRVHSGAALDIAKDRSVSRRSAKPEEISPKAMI